LWAERRYSRAAFLVWLCLALAFPFFSASGGDRPTFDTGVVRLDRGDGTILSFSVEIARTPPQWSFGLMHTASMPDGQGMLFVFPTMAPRSFWMKNTLIPLDMLFFAEDGGLVSAVQDVPPHSLTPRRSAGDARFVLELNGGVMAAQGITGAARLLDTRNDGW
jgi:uncharacterized membrane protein (UPF0127 family)